MLGEAAHGDGTAFLTKIRLIKFLHEEMGFNVLAFESSLYDCIKAQAEIEAGANIAQVFGQSVYPIWNQSVEVQPLIEYLQSTQTSNPLQLTGFDNQLAGYYSETMLTDDLAQFLSQTLDTDPQDEELRQFNITLKSIILSVYSSGGIAPSAEKQASFFDYIDQTLAELEPLAVNDRETSFWVQVLKSARSYANLVWGMAVTNQAGSDPDPELVGTRDIQMGENLLWLADEYYPDQKIIVWAATYHVSRSLDTVTVIDPNLASIFGGQVMGDVVYDSLQDQVYTIGITAYSGTSGIFSYDTLVLEPPSENSLEDLMKQAGYEYAFLDLRHLSPGGTWLQGNISSRMIGHSEMVADWSQIVDGVIFVQVMEPSNQVP